MNTHYIVYFPDYVVPTPVPVAAITTPSPFSLPTTSQATNSAFKASPDILPQPLRIPSKPPVNKNNHDMKRVRFKLNSYCSYHLDLKLKLEIIKEIDLAAGESEKECAVDCAIDAGKEPCLGFAYHKMSNRCTLLKLFSKRLYNSKASEICYIVVGRSPSSCDAT